MTTRSNPTIALVSTFPPTVCGIASYSASLVAALTTEQGGPLGRPGVVRLIDGPARSTGPSVDFQHRTGDLASLRRAAAVLNTYETVSIQHEFGIYGGRDGAEVLDLMSRLTVPAAATLHTVLSDPSSHQQAILEGICDLAERIIVMSETASNRLVDRYGIDPSQISVIAHGADPEFGGPSLVTGDRPLILTWGLIGPGKGLESAIEACADLADMKPLPRYRIVGATHPNVRRNSGEKYREGLMELTSSLGLGEMVEFDDRYLSRGDLARLVRRADLVLLPYESYEQVTSGVLVEAIAASKPVVATAFPHAVELLSGGAGAVVPFGEPHLLAAEVRRILSDSESRMMMGQRAHQLAAEWYWPTVAGHFATVMSDIAAIGRLISTSTHIRQRAAG
ncbi:MAG TPA: glycosyltransferase [Acidimicrobiia bacterium]|nr:glycosyltransferase [Acidimicrobiia bacterium]